MAKSLISGYMIILLFPKHVLGLCIHQYKATIGAIIFFHIQTASRAQLEPAQMSFFSQTFFFLLKGFTWSDSRSQARQRLDLMIDRVN